MSCYLKFLELLTFAEILGIVPFTKLALFFALNHDSYSFLLLVEKKPKPCLGYQKGVEEKRFFKDFFRSLLVNHSEGVEKNKEQKKKRT